jgi:hypothetical protein
MHHDFPQQTPAQTIASVVSLGLFAAFIAAACIMLGGA